MNRCDVVWRVLERRDARARRKRRDLNWIGRLAWAGLRWLGMMAVALVIFVAVPVLVCLCF